MDRLNDNKKIIGLYDTKKVLHPAFLFHGRVGKGQETEKKSCERK